MTRALSPAMILALLERCADSFALDPRNPRSDAVIGRVFTDHPTNTDNVWVLLKVTVLNTLYNAGLLEPHRMAEYITSKLSTRLDKYLSRGDHAAVGCLRTGHGIQKPKNPGERDLYSFAAKYCHWHRPDIYPMFDQYVEVAITNLDDSLPTPSKYADLDVRDFGGFVARLENLRRLVGWRRPGFKELDQALWILGQVIRENADDRVRASVGKLPPQLSLARV